MPERVEYFHFLREIFPHAGPELLRLLQGAAENALLLRSDFYTIRDWLEIAECRADDVPAAILLLMLVALEEGACASRLPSRRWCGGCAISFGSGGGELGHACRASRCGGQLCGAHRHLGARSETGHPPHNRFGPDFRSLGDFGSLRGHERFTAVPVFQKYLRAELDFQRDLQDRLEQKSAPSSAAWPTVLQEVMDSQALRLDRAQRLAWSPRWPKT